MTFDFAEYLVLARELRGERDRTSSMEAKFRSAISRAYYAAYMISCNNLREERVEIPSDVTGHERVPMILQGSSDIRKRLIGEKLERLRRSRNSADYGKEISQLEKASSGAVLEASNIINLFERIKSSKDASVTNKIKKKECD
jgi:hypothetical protein